MWFKFLLGTYVGVAYKIFLQCMKNAYSSIEVCDDNLQCDHGRGAVKSLIPVGAASDHLQTTVL